MAKKVSLTDDAISEEDLVNIEDEVDGDGVITFDEDLTDAEPAEPLPDGDYIATIIKAEKTESKTTKGSYYIRVDFLISPDQFPADYAPDNAPEEGAMVSYRRLSLAETRNARYAIKKFLLAVGYPLSKRLVLAELITRQAKVTLKTEEFDSIPRNAIDRVSAVD